MLSLSIMVSVTTATEKPYESGDNWRHGVYSSTDSNRLFDSHKSGLRYSILKIQWPQDKDPQQVSNFETLARKLRYMALGQACLKHDIQSLLVAHHMDDQAETVLMRIAQGHRGTGLKGILPVSDIPECWAVHGIHQSGASEATEKVEERIKARLGQRYLNKKSPKQDIVRERSPPLKIEDGGITVYRPFLGFEKERLKATCRVSQVRWIEDQTNQNPALTPRNTIRQLLQLERLPKAIQKASLSALAKRMERKHATRTTRAENMFGLCDITMLDTRVGAMTVRFICKPLDRSPIPALHVHQAILNKEYHFAMMLRRMMEMVTPAQRISLESLHAAVKAIIRPRLGPIAEETASKFTCGGVYFERVRSILSSSGFSPASPSLPPRQVPPSRTREERRAMKVASSVFGTAASGSACATRILGPSSSVPFTPLISPYSAPPFLRGRQKSSTSFSGSWLSAKFAGRCRSSPRLSKMLLFTKQKQKTARKQGKPPIQRPPKKPPITRPQGTTAKPKKPITKQNRISNHNKPKYHQQTSQNIDPQKNRAGVAGNPPPWL